MKKEMIKPKHSPAVLFLLFILKVVAGIITIVLGSLSNQPAPKPKTSYDRLIELAKIEPSVIDQNRPDKS